MFHCMHLLSTVCCVSCVFPLKPLSLGFEQKITRMQHVRINNVILTASRPEPQHRFSQARHALAMLTTPARHSRGKKQREQRQPAVGAPVTSAEIEVICMCPCARVYLCLWVSHVYQYRPGDACCKEEKLVHPQLSC